MLGKRRRNVQVGRGLGSIFSKIFSKIAPIAKTLFNFGKKALASKPVKNVVNAAKDTAIQSGIQVIDDVIQGKNVGESLKENAAEASKKIGIRAADEAKDFLQGKISGPPRKKSKTKYKSKKKKKKDVFS